MSRCCAECDHLASDCSPAKAWPSIWCVKGHFDTLSNYNTLYDDTDCKDHCNEEQGATEGAE